jgi:SAM-dependent methyltransferase
MGNAAWRPFATAIFAHAGEEAAVRMAWECLPRRANQSCLDPGCGRGGTAALVQAERWGQVIGLDIDSETISFAQSAYSNVRFVAADVTCAGGLFPAHFDISYAFNAFYAFPDQQAALSAHVSLRSLKPFFAFLITSTKEDSIKPASPENLRRRSGVHSR